MSNDDWNQNPDGDRFDAQYDDAQFADTRYSDERYQPPKPGMSTGMKVLIILLILMGVGGLLCCGGVAYMLYRLGPKMSSDPAEVNRTRDEIATIKLPAEFEPTMSMRMDNIMFSMKSAIYQTKDRKSSLLFGGMEMKIGEAGANQDVQFRESMKQGGAKEDLRNVQSSTQKLKVKGVEREFLFTTGEDNSGKKFREITGSFPGKRGMAFFVYQAEEEVYKEDEIVRMLEAIE